MKVWFNGHICSQELAHIAPDDRGFLLGDGFFETMRAHKGKVAWLDAHYKRFLKHAHVLKFDTALFPTYQEIQKAIAILSQQAPGDAVVRLSASRGQATRRLVPISAITPTLLLTMHTFKVDTSPLALATTQKVRRNPWSLASRVKSTNYLDNIMAAIEAYEKGANDALILSVDGTVAETSKANIACFRQNVLYSPGAFKGALEGLARAFIMAELASMGISFGGETIDYKMLVDADLVFVCNALQGMRMVKSIDKVDVLVSAKTQKIYDALRTKIATALSFG